MNNKLKKTKKHNLKNKIKHYLLEMLVPSIQRQIHNNQIKEINF